ncbi:inositol monophosphatase family protein [Micromonospora sp. MH99]|uniref:inositol monophosphatase family protein n=1 Tax=Micromonospora sp. MH99 TaxID=1945510 RepID=UPI001F465199|nr:inositol monophosphatase family protein [Micromonospora sp. MH99]MCF0096771.1 Fructose-1,6-bisphosphatase/inositol-1-monophosphatase [Micromonospora sp. MH99]
MNDYVDLLPLAHEAIDLAHGLMRTVQPGALTFKDDRDMASELDYTIEREVRELLAAKAPDIGFLGEEYGTSGNTSTLTWTFDPVDGTVNFIHGSPLCGISLGLVQSVRSVLGVIDLPFLGTRYHAVEGHGAYANGDRIRASRVSDLKDAVVAIGDYAVGADASRKNADRLAITEELTRHVQRVRMHGSAAIDLAWLAQGRIDAFIMLNNKPWDTAAGVVIAQEAGAQVVDLDGTAHSTCATATVGGNDLLLPDILTLVERSLARVAA